MYTRTGKNHEKNPFLLGKNGFKVYCLFTEKERTKVQLLLVPTNLRKLEHRMHSHQLKQL